jgi:hypothetical protein
MHLYAYVFVYLTTVYQLHWLFGVHTSLTLNDVLEGMRVEGTGHAVSKVLS